MYNKLLCTLIILHISNIFASYTPQKNPSEGIEFLMVYETYKPLDIRKSVLYYSKSKWLHQEEDSLVIDLKKPGTPDSIGYDTIWQHPIYMKLRLYFNGRFIESQPFSSSSTPAYYDTFVGDSTLKVRPKLSGNNFESNSSLKALVLVLQAVFEMIIAFFIARVFDVPRLLILMVLVANIAAYPLYLFNLSLLNRELLVFLVKAVVMSLIGIRKIKLFKILILVATLTIISLGMKEILFFGIRLF
jgi:hypothetical protein